MVVPFGSALERRSRTTYRPTVTPEGSTHVDTAFTGTTSSFFRTASRKVAVVAVVRQTVFCGGAVAGCHAVTRLKAKAVWLTSPNRMIAGMTRSNPFNA
ncbi:hypothetical protein GCM10009753_74170 [Streptantibioticus ferralitis]